MKRAKNNIRCKQICAYATTVISVVLFKCVFFRHDGDRSTSLWKMWAEFHRARHLCLSQLYQQTDHSDTPHDVHAWSQFYSHGFKCTVAFIYLVILTINRFNIKVMLHLSIVDEIPATTASTTGSHQSQESSRPKRKMNPNPAHSPSSLEGGPYEQPENEGNCVKRLRKEVAGDTAPLKSKGSTKY